jgi:zinc finger protein
MDEVALDIACPICREEGQVKMRTHVDEIPYFGEHTQVTVLCGDCGWRQTDFIPAEGKKPSACELELGDEACMSVRVIRSSSCTVQIPELDLEVSPGNDSTGYVSNVEGVLERFIGIINMLKKQKVVDGEYADVLLLDHMVTVLASARSGSPIEPLTLRLLDPRGHSMILCAETKDWHLSAEEVASLPMGPDIPTITA